MAEIPETTFRSRVQTDKRGRFRALDTDTKGVVPGRAYYTTRTNVVLFRMWREKYKKMDCTTYTNGMMSEKEIKKEVRERIIIRCDTVQK